MLRASVADQLRGLDEAVLQALLDRADPLNWAQNTARIRLPKRTGGTGVISFEMHPFLPDIYRDTHPFQVWLKGAQVGMSTCAIIRTLWAATLWSLSPVYCVDDETEALTARGWTNAVVVGDLLYTLDQLTGRAAWRPVLEVFDSPYRGPMVGLHNRSFDALVTPNHQWLLQSPWSSSMKFAETTELGGLTQWGIPLRAPYDGAGVEDSDAFLQLLGWVAAEGHYRVDRWHVILAQNQRKAEMIRTVLADLDATEGTRERTDADGVSYWRLPYGLCVKLRERFPDKSPTPGFIAGMTSEQAATMLAAFMEGDGWATAENRGFSQRDASRADAFGMAAVLAGEGMNFHDYQMGQRMQRVVNLRRNATVRPISLSADVGLYEGRIWCPRTEAGTFLARRNGSVHWTGNTFPTRGDVTEYTQSRIDPIITGSEYLTDRILDIDRMSTKRFSLIGRSERPDLARATRAVREQVLASSGFSTVYFRGASQPRDAVSVDADILIHDEEDESNPNVIDAFKSRISGPSNFKWITRLSTPTIPNYGIDAAYRASNRNKWLINCPGCNDWVEFRYPDSVVPATWEEHLAQHPSIAPNDPCPYCHYRCSSCGRRWSDDVRATRGKWVAESNDLSLPHGYAVSQMAALFTPASAILKARFDYKLPRLFWNLVMGIAHDEGLASFTLEQLVGGSEVGSYGRTDPTTPMVDSSDLPCFIGVDTSPSWLDIVVDGIDGGVVRMLRCAREKPLGTTLASAWAVLDGYMDRFNPISVVIDAQPETTLARQWAAKYNRPGERPRVWLNWYNTQPKSDQYVTDPDHWKVSSPRTRSLSETANEILGSKVLPQWNPGDPAYLAFVEHMTNSKRVPRYRRRPTAGDQTSTDPEDVAFYEWVAIGNGADHLFHASNYARIARQVVPRPEYVPTSVARLLATNRSRIERDRELGRNPPPEPVPQQGSGAPRLPGLVRRTRR